MALRLKVLKNVPGGGETQSLDAPNHSEQAPGEGTSRGPVQAEPRRRDHIYNQTALQGW